MRNDAFVAIMLTVIKKKCSIINDYLYISEFQLGMFPWLSRKCWLNFKTMLFHNCLQREKANIDLQLLTNREPLAKYTEAEKQLIWFFR